MKKLLDYWLDDVSLSSEISFDRAYTLQFRSLYSFL